MYKHLNPEQNLAGYAGKVVETLLRSMAFEIQKTLKSSDPDNVHDLRVTCLRLRHALRLFGKLLPAKAARKVRGRLAKLQELLAGVRNCDIALQILGHKSIAPSLSPARRRVLAGKLGQERQRAGRAMRLRLRKMQRSDVLARWRSRLMATG
ncbi:MAG: CHAD domain-containing protein [Acidobacteria bacterium]|nr:CHAD domain-containing protein [Acidobacteriota bacterium]